jgi:hypothetical protein
LELQGKASRDGCDAVRRVCATVRMVVRWGAERLGRIWRRLEIGRRSDGEMMEDVVIS